MYTCPAMTEAKFKTFRKNEVRKLWLRWPPRNEVLKLARRRVVIGKFLNGNDKYGFEHQCAICKEYFPQIKAKPSVTVDHIEPVGGWSDDIRMWGRDLGRMWQRSLCGVEGLRVLCDPCHRVVTNEQLKERSK